MTPTPEMWKPWDVLEGPFQVATPWAREMTGMPAAAVILSDVAFGDAEDVVLGLSVIAFVRLKEMSWAFNADLERRAFARAETALYDGPLVTLTCQECGATDDAWTTDDGHLADPRDLRCACGAKTPMQATP